MYCNKCGMTETADSSRLCLNCRHRWCSAMVCGQEELLSFFHERQPVLVRSVVTMPGTEGKLLIQFALDEFK